MSRVRVLVGTRKGAFVLKSDAKRERWEIAGPHFGGWEIYHITGSSADPARLYASQSDGGHEKLPGDGHEAARWRSWDLPDTTSSASPRPAVGAPVRVRWRC